MYEIILELHLKFYIDFNINRLIEFQKGTDNTMAISGTFRYRFRKADPCSFLDGPVVTPVLSFYTPVVALNF